ncbi:MAG: TlpA disulfide reductase family protein [Rhodothermales bacterium]
MPDDHATSASKPRFNWRREALEWGLVLAILGGLYISGLHTEVAARLQQALLWTGILQPDLSMPVEEQALARYDVIIRPLNGESIALGDLRDRPIFLNLWATWCPPCLAELPGIQALYEEVGDEVAFVLLSTDENDAEVQAFIEAKGYTVPVYRLGGALPAIYQSPVLPTTFVISPEGRIVLREEGMARYDTDRFKAYLRSLAE